MASTSSTLRLDGSAIGKSDYEKLSLIRYRLRRFLRVSEDLCQAEGLTALQYQLLLHVRGFPGRDWAIVSELAERLQAKHHGVVALLDRCAKAGLVERRPSPGNRRQVEIHLLPKGEALLARLAALHRPELGRLKEEFGAAGETAANDDLRREAD